MLELLTEVIRLALPWVIGALLFIGAIFVWWLS